MTAATGSGRPTAPEPPWYRHPMVWLIIAIPGSAVLVGSLLLTLAIVTPESVVREDYYQAGRTINIDLRETHQAADLGISATFQGHPDDGWLLRVSPRRADTAVEGGLEVLLAHPTLASRDREIALSPDGRGAWSGMLEPIGGRHMLTIRPLAGGWLLRREVVLESSDDERIEVSARPWGAPQ